MVRQTIEGTWEEIVQRASELAGHRVRLTVLEDAPKPDKIPPSEQTLDKLLAGYIGMVASDPPQNLSERVDEVFGQIVDEKRRKWNQAK